MLVHVDDDVKMTGRTAGGAGFAFALKAELLPGCDPTGNLDGDFSLARHASRAATGLAGLRDDLSGAAALRARTRDREEALLETDLAVTLALRARARRRSLGRARAVARPAVLLARNLNRRLGAASRFFERDLEVVPQVGAAPRPAAPASAAAKHVAEPEHVAEDIGEVAEFGEHGRIEARAAARRGADAGVPEAVVQAALLRVRDDGIRLGRLLELFFRELVARIAIRVVLHRELPVSAFDFDVGRRARDAEDFVVIAFAHAFATFTIAGRSRRSFIM